MSRDYMIAFRKKNVMTLRHMAKVCQCSETLLSMLEESESNVTHPSIAKRISRAYCMSDEQYLDLIPRNYRPNDLNYDPEMFVEKDSRRKV